MNRTLAALLTFLLLGCEKPAPPAVETVERPVTVQYVGASKLDVRTAANDGAELIAAYRNGEAISVLGTQGEWSEIRVGERSGWARSAGLVDAATADAQANNTTVRFRRPPMPVSANGVRGDIHLEASVNADGEVIDVKVVTNTTGSHELLQRNIQALRHAQFEPMMVKGERKAFTYDHRASY